jgi:hypothetical protein
MTTLTDTQVVTASGGLVELGYSQITSNVTITSTNAASPQIVIPDLTIVSDGSPLLVEFSYTNLNIGPGMAFGFWVDGVRQGNLGIPPGSSGGNFFSRLVLSAGSHTVRVVGWLGGAGTATLYASNGTSGNDNPAFLRVSKIVSATQWPAVTTGTIICTSTTRPASPFEGQTIYETDTKRSWTRVGTQWVPNDMVFTNEAARDAAITSPTEGMRAYLTAPTVPAATGATTAVPTGITTIYNGSAWVCTTPVSAYTATTGTTTSGTYTATLTSGGTNPSVTLATGTTALVMVSVTGSVNPAPTTIITGVAVSGATTLAVSGQSNAAYVGMSGGYIGTMTLAKVITGLTAGTNTFTIQYQSGAGNTASFFDRNITVQGIA